MQWKEYDLLIRNCLSCLVVGPAQAVLTQSCAQGTLRAGSYRVLGIKPGVCKASVSLSELSLHTQEMSEF